MSRRVAIVEDEMAIRENYADVLRKQGYDVQTYSNRKEAMLALVTKSANDVATAVAFLAGESSAMITGTSLVVDGGWTAQ